MCDREKTRTEKTAKLFTVVFYGLKKLGRKTAQFCGTRREH